MCTLPLSINLELEMCQWEDVLFVKFRKARLCSSILSRISQSSQGNQDLAHFTPQHLRHVNPVTNIDTGSCILHNHVVPLTVRRTIRYRPDKSQMDALSSAEERSTVLFTIITLNKTNALNTTSPSAGVASGGFYYVNGSQFALFGRCRWRTYRSCMIISIVYRASLRFGVADVLQVYREFRFAFTLNASLDWKLHLVNKGTPNANS